MSNTVEKQIEKQVEVSDITENGHKIATIEDDSTDKIAIDQSNVEKEMSSPNKDWGKLKINPNLIGVFITLINALLKATSSALLKFSTVEAPVLSFIRSILQVLLCIPVILYTKSNIIVKPEYQVNLMIAAIVNLNIIVSVFSVQFIPVGEATAVQFCAPIFTIIFAKILLKEHCGKYKAFVLILSLVGAITVINPVKLVNDIAVGTHVIDHVIGCSLSLLSALGIGLTSVLTRYLRDINFSVIAFWYSSTMTICSLILMGIFQSFEFPKTNEEIVISLGAGLSGAAANMLFALALHYGDAGLVMIVKSTEVIFTGIYQILLFNDQVTSTTGAGAFLICLGILLLNTKGWIMANLNRIKSFIGSESKSQH